MNGPVLIGARIPPGLDQVRLFRQLKLGDCILVAASMDRDEALAVARYCREHEIVLFLNELTARGRLARHPAAASEERLSRDDIAAVAAAAGPCYGGRLVIGEAGGMLYWPKQYLLGRRAGDWPNLPPVRTTAEARDAYIEYLRTFLEFERTHSGPGPLLNIDSALVFKYHAEAGVDGLCHESMPGDPHLMHAAIRGAARAYDKPWGTHIAMQWYGGVRFDELWQKRWKTALYHAYIAGAEFIWPESGHYTYDKGPGRRYGFRSRELKRVRRTLREMYRFARIHTRPEGGPRVRLGVVHGHLDGAPGLWNRYVWGQFKGNQWRVGPAEKGWELVDRFHRKEEWSNPFVQGARDFSGNPPLGQYDVVPVEAPLAVLRGYACLVFLGWNTMTEEIYDKLKRYVRAGGRLVMSLPHLSTHTDRARDLRLFRGGDFRDLFGVKVLGIETTGVRGFKCTADASISSYRFPTWRVDTDPKFLGRFTPARLQLAGARILSSYDDFFDATPEQLARQPVLVENALGAGHTFLVAVREYPGDDELRPFSEDVLRTVLGGEQGDIRLIAGDRVRYAVYDGKLPGRGRRFTVVYLLNTDPDAAATAALWVRGRETQPFPVPANSLRIAYLCGKLIMVPEDPCLDLASWQAERGRHVFVFTNLHEQEMDVYNLGPSAVHLRVNGRSRRCPAAGAARFTLPARADPSRRKFFADDFLEEPDVNCRKTV